MGHEISHALANHTAEKMSVAMASQLAVLGVGVASKSAGKMAAAQGLAIVAVTLPNSRTAETEADRIGIELAAKAGYDPRAASTLWQKMAKAGGNGPPQFLSTHPAPGNRQATLAALEAQMMPYYLHLSSAPPRADSSPSTSPGPRMANSSRLPSAASRYTFTWPLRSSST
jgi:predicted Zn-dependent protease